MISPLKSKMNASSHLPRKMYRDTEQNLKADLCGFDAWFDELDEDSFSSLPTNLYPIEKEAEEIEQSLGTLPAYGIK
ncbi:Hypothetical protein FKW44_006689, partial [Caligus rogercresseyi]